MQSNKILLKRIYFAIASLSVFLLPKVLYAAQESKRVTYSTQDNARLLQELKSGFKIATGQGDYYTIGCLLDYFHFRENYKLIATDSSNQQVLKANPRSIQQINFTGNLDRDGNTISFSLSKKQKELFWIFHEEL